jgi:hypothetical protein
MNSKRSRGGRAGGRKPQTMGGQRNFDSNGPNVKIRGSAAHIFDRYCQLARDANASGDRIAAENYMQHAEHYYRIMMLNGGPPQRNGNGAGGGTQPVAPAVEDDEEVSMAESVAAEIDGTEVA